MYFFLWNISYFFFLFISGACRPNWQRTRSSYFDLIAKSKQSHAQAMPVSGWDWNTNSSEACTDLQRWTRKMSNTIYWLVKGYNIDVHQKLLQRFRPETTGDWPNDYRVQQKLYSWPSSTCFPSCPLELPIFCVTAWLPLIHSLYTHPFI